MILSWWSHIGRQVRNSSSDESTRVTTERELIRVSDGIFYAYVLCGFANIKLGWNLNEYWFFIIFILYGLYWAIHLLFSFISEPYRLRVNWYRKLGLSSSSVWRFPVSTMEFQHFDRVIRNVTKKLWCQVSMESNRLWFLSSEMLQDVFIHRL